MVVRVDPKARPFFERIELEVAIDDNLVLWGQARSMMGGEVANVEIHNLEFGVAVGGATTGTSRVP
jgi:hypothetical protein